MSKERAKLNNLLEKTIESEVSERVSSIKAENEDLHARVQRLQGKVSELTIELHNLKHDDSQSSVMLNLIEHFKDKFYAVENKPNREELVYKMLESFFDKDFDENTYECPIWLGACTQFYSHRTEVVEILKALEIYIPENIDNFRLPHEWTTEELDIVFDTMNKHYVCNGCIYEDNLRFWKPNALSDVYSVCYNSGSYTEIPWQFLLRNPNLLNEKYLKKIGKMAFEEYNGHWSYFFKIQQYQELTPEQIKLIITNMNEYHTFDTKHFQKATEFLLKNMEYFPEGPLLKSFYECFKDSYDFKYNDIVLKLPVTYVEDWITRMHNPFEWIERNRNKLNDEQKKELLRIVMEVYLK